MSREELEKIIDNNDSYLSNWKTLKEFIFETIIQEVLKSVIAEECFKYDDYFNAWYNRATEDIKQKAKDLYNITL